jgi:hypothetical protein
MKAYCGGGGMAPYIVDLSTVWILSGQLHTRHFTSRKRDPGIQWDRSLGGPQSQPGCGGEDKNSQHLPTQPVAQCYTTELYPLNRRLGGSQGQSGSSEEKKFPAPARIRTLDHPVCSPVLYPLDRRLGGPQGQSGHSGKGRNSQSLPGLNPQSPTP